MLNTLIYCWCASDGFTAAARPCLFGCKRALFEHAHFPECLATEVIQTRVCPYTPGPGCIASVLPSVADEGEGEHRAAFMCVHLLDAYDAKLHGRVLWAEISIFARLKELRRRHPNVRKLKIRDGRLDIGGAQLQRLRRCVCFAPFEPSADAAVLRPPFTRRGARSCARVEFARGRRGEGRVSVILGSKDGEFGPFFLAVCVCVF